MRFSLTALMVIQQNFITGYVETSLAKVLTRP